MAPTARTAAADYPSDELLRKLTADLEALHGHFGSQRVLDLLPAPRFPAPLGPCFEVDVSMCKASSFVLSQQRSKNELYITVSGKRAHHSGKGVKKQRSTVPWPRTRSTDRLRPVSLHRWITFSTRGPPPSQESEASHICGNQRCIAAGHLQWQSRAENLTDRTFHLKHPPTSVRTRHAPKRHYSRIEWL